MFPNVLSNPGGRNPPSHAHLQLSLLTLYEVSETSTLPSLSRMPSLVFLLLSLYFSITSFECSVVCSFMSFILIESPACPPFLPVVAANEICNLLFVRNTDVNVCTIVVTAIVNTSSKQNGNALSCWLEFDIMVDIGEMSLHRRDGSNGTLSRDLVSSFTNTVLSLFNATHYIENVSKNMTVDGRITKERQGQGSNE